jgi:hypothetical protein
VSPAPHGTLLATFLGAERILALEVVGRTQVDRRVAFVRAGVAVEQVALPGRAIVRMTAHPVTALPRVLLGPLDLAIADPPLGRTALELSERSLAHPPESASGPVKDLAHAWRRRIILADTRHEGHRVERDEASWLDAGELGWWRLEPAAGSPGVLRATPAGVQELIDAVGEQGWAAA